MKDSQIYLLFAFAMFVASIFDQSLFGSFLLLIFGFVFGACALWLQVKEHRIAAVKIELELAKFEVINDRLEEIISLLGKKTQRRDHGNKHK